jgi:8-oxo-dGTP diphosphatase
MSEPTVSGIHGEAESARLTADVVVLAERGHQRYVLLIERGWPPFEGKWALPGGHVDIGEDVQAAGRRELAEETGVAADLLDLVGTYSQPGRDPRGRYVTWAWVAQFNHLPQATAGDDACAARCWPLAEALAQPERLAFDHHQILVDAVESAG